MVLRGRGAFLQKGPSPPKLPERGLAKAFPVDGGMKRSRKPKRGTWAYPELKNAQGTKKNGRHCSGDWL